MSYAQMLCAAGVAATAMLGWVQPATAGVFTDWTETSVVSSGSMPSASSYMPGSGAEYMWYCGGSVVIPRAGIWLFTQRFTARPKYRTV